MQYILFMITVSIGPTLPGVGNLWFSGSASLSEETEGLIFANVYFILAVTGTT